MNATEAEAIGAEVARRRGCTCGGLNGCGCFNVGLRVVNTGITVDEALADYQRRADEVSARAHATCKEGQP